MTYSDAGESGTSAAADILGLPSLRLTAGFEAVLGHGAGASRFDIHTWHISCRPGVLNHTIHIQKPATDLEFTGESKVSP